MSWAQAGAVLTLVALFALVAWATWWSERSTYNPGNDDEAYDDRDAWRRK